MVEVITESDMNFISDSAFYIEKSTLYTELGKGIKSVEFIVFKEHLEADSLCYQPQNGS